MKQSTHSESERINQITSTILNAAITVHKEMGPGLLETIYQHCLVAELRSRKLSVETMILFHFATKVKR